MADKMMKLEAFVIRKIKNFGTMDYVSSIWNEFSKNDNND